MSCPGWFLGVSGLYWISVTISYYHLRCLQGASYLGHYSFNPISAIAKAPWSSNIFNRTVSFLKKTLRPRSTFPASVWWREVLESPSIYGLGLKREEKLLLTAVLSAVISRCTFATYFPSFFLLQVSFFGTSVVEPHHSTLLFCDYVHGGREGRACVPPLGITSVKTSLAQVFLVQTSTL